MDRRFYTCIAETEDCRFFLDLDSQLDVIQHFMIEIYKAEFRLVEVSGAEKKLGPL